MAFPQLPDLASLLEDWCRSLESGDPDRIAALYDSKATVAYRRSCLQGRSELGDFLQSQHRRLQRLRIDATEVEHASPQRLLFTAQVAGAFGRATVRNDWTIQDGRIRDHAMRLVDLEPADAPRAA